MKLAHHPESLSHLPPDLNVMAERARRSTRPFLVTLLAVIVPGLLLFRAPLPRLELFPWWFELFSVPVSLIIGLYLTIAWHELGHIAAARMAGFQVVFVMIGPVQLTRTPAGWKLLQSGYTGFVAQGRVMALPPRELWFNRPELRRRLLWIFAGGPLATLVQALVLFGVLFLTPPGFFNQVERTALIAIALLSSLFLAWTAYPMQVNELLNDMGQIRRLRRRNQGSERLLALLVLNAQAVAGVRARNLDEETLAVANAHLDGSPEGLAGRLYAMAQADDEGLHERLAIYLDDALAHIRRLPPSKRPAPLLWNAAAFEAQVGLDPVAARGWLDLAGRTRYPMFVEAQIARLAAETAVYLAERDLPAAAASAFQAHKLIPFSYNMGGVLPIREWLEALFETHQLVDPQPQPLRLSQLIWQPIVQSCLMTALVILVLSFVLVLAALR